MALASNTTEALEPLRLPLQVYSTVTLNSIHGHHPWEHTEGPGLFAVFEKQIMIKSNGPRSQQTVLNVKQGLDIKVCSQLVLCVFAI